MGLQVKGVYPDMRPLLCYSYGAENIPISGGWVPGYRTGTGSQSKQTNRLSLGIANNATGERTYVTDKLINLSSLNRLVINWNYYTDDGTCHAALVVSTNKTGSHSTSINKSVSINGYFGSGESTVDVSELSGYYYIRVHVSKATSNRPGASLYVYEIRGEV